MSERWRCLIKRLSSDEMAAVLCKMQRVLNKRRNYTMKEVEIVEYYVIDGNVIKFQKATNLLRSYFTKQRALLTNIDNRHHNIITAIAGLRYKMWMNYDPHKHSYRPLTRGNLKILNKNYNTSLGEYKSGMIWIFLRLIVRLAINEHTMCRLEYTAPHDCFLTFSGRVKDILLNLGRVSKEWLVVIKHHCVWWGPDGKWFAFVPGSIDKIKIKK